MKTCRDLNFRATKRLLSKGVIKAPDKGAFLNQKQYYCNKSDVHYDKIIS
jgi:hypothetical protein